MATIQTTKLEERETGDIKQLRDHDIAEGPVSTNSADATSLKSVPLTLEDGSIIKVRFDSLVTAIGQALGASEDSTVTKVLGLNGTVPKGIGMANLASVLGVGLCTTRIKFYETARTAQDFYENEAADECIFLAYANIRGIVYAYIGLKATVLYGNLFKLSYYSNQFQRAIINNGEWTWGDL